MGKIKKYIFKRKGIAPNIFIGGIAPNIVDEETVANYLRTYPSEGTVLASDIENLTIDGNDISFYIGMDYVLRDNAFNLTAYGTASPTFYNDAGGKCKKLSISSFYRSYNTLLCDFKGVVTVEGKLFYDAGYPRTAPIVIHLDACTYIGDPTVADELMFGYQSANAKTLYTNSFLATNNAGGIDATIAYAQANQNLTVIFV